MNTSLIMRLIITLIVFQCAGVVDRVGVDPPPAVIYLAGCRANRIKLWFLHRWPIVAPRAWMSMVLVAYSAPDQP